MKKRADGRYPGSITVGRKENGKPDIKHFYGRTKKELEEKRAELKRQLKLGTYIDNEMTLRELSERWMRGKAGRAQRTVSMYRDNLDRHILPELGNLLLTDIKTYHVQDLITSLFATPRTAEIVQMTLNQMFKKALADELAIKNPASKDKLDMPSARSKKKRAITDLEQKSIDSASLNDKERAYILLCLHAGLRRSEARALMWSDVAKGKITVQRAMDEDDSIKPFAKTDAGHRTIPMDDVLTEFFKTYKRSGLYVIPNQKGTPLTLQQYKNFWDRVTYKLNLAVGGTGHITKSKIYKVDICAIGTDFSAHILRHTFATKLAEAGYTPAEIMYLMGHSTARLALEVYTHVQHSQITADRLNKPKPDTTEQQTQNKT